MFSGTRREKEEVVQTIFTDPDPDDRRSGWRIPLLFVRRLRKRRMPDHVESCYINNLRRNIRSADRVYYYTKQEKGE